MTKQVWTKPSVTKVSVKGATKGGSVAGSEYGLRSGASSS